MCILLKWDDITIIVIHQIGKMFISQVNVTNLEKAKKKGLLLGLLSDVKVISSELPNLILKRIPEHRRGDYADFIRETQCRYATDKFSVSIL